MKLAIPANVLFAVLLCGCEARQMNLVAPDLGILTDVRRPVTEKDIQEAFDRRPDVRAGSTIGIVHVPQSNRSGLEVRTVAAEESKAWQSAFLDNYFVTAVVFLSSVEAPSVRDSRLLRKNAATLNCDMLLVYGVSCDYSRRPNPLAALYLTVVGGFFVPGDTITGGCIAKAALMDVRSGYVYGVVEASATQTMAVPMVWIPGTVSRIYENVSAQALRGARDKLRPLIDRLRDQVVEIAD